MPVTPLLKHMAKNATLTLCQSEVLQVFGHSKERRHACIMSPAWLAPASAIAPATRFGTTCKAIIPLLLTCCNRIVTPVDCARVSGAPPHLAQGIRLVEQRRLIHTSLSV